MRKTVGLDKKSMPTSSKNRRQHNLQQKLFKKINELDLDQPIITSKNNMRNTYQNGWTKINCQIHNINTLYNHHDQTIRDQKQVIANKNKDDQFITLLQKAKQITEQNQQKIAKQKIMRGMKVLKKQKEPLFLTDTGLYSMNSTEEYPSDMDGQLNLDEMLKDLVIEQNQNDLEELRRMIKITGDNLNQYNRQIYHSSKGVVTAAQQFKKHVDTMLLHKMNKLNLSENQNGKKSQGNRVKTKVKINSIK